MQFDRRNLAIILALFYTKDLPFINYKDAGIAMLASGIIMYLVIYFIMNRLLKEPKNAD